MKQFDVCRAAVGPLRKADRLVVVLQHPHVDHIGTLIVAPLYSPKDLPVITQLRLAVRVDRKSYVVAVDRLAALPTNELGRTVANLERHRDQFSRAWDLLFFGF
jgi:toxin CcdB